MPVNVERDSFDENLGFQYYISFKPHMGVVESAQEVHMRIDIQASVSVSETGELVDFSFVLPKSCRSEQALTFIRKQATVNIVPPRVSVSLPGHSSDAVATAAAQLDLDLAGRIIGMQINWMPSEGALS
ncbi:MAG: hypothetical protein ACE14M_02715 [Terriglobales bacterium]